MSEFTHQGVLKQGKSPHHVLALGKTFGPGEVVPLDALGARKFADQFDDIRPIEKETAVSTSQAAAVAAEKAKAEAAKAAEAEAAKAAEAAGKGKK